MNPFSDSVQYKIHATHVMSIGQLEMTYIDTYNNAVNAIEKSLLNKYQVYTQTEETPEMDEYDEILNDVKESKTIH